MGQVRPIAIIILVGLTKDASPGNSLPHSCGIHYISKCSTFSLVNNQSNKFEMIDEMCVPVISPEKNHGRISIPLFIRDRFNRKDHISITSILKFILEPAISIFKHPEFITNQLDHSKFLPVLTAQEFHFHKSLHNSASIWLQQGGFNRTTLHLHLRQFGRISYMPQYELYSDNQLLISGKHHVVYVDQCSRVPISIPEALKRRLLQSSTERMEFPQRPLNARCQQLRIRPSDLDYNFHTNSAVYFQLVHNIATTLSVEENAFEFFEGDLANYLLKSVKNRFTGETKMGDLLDCYVWQDAQNPLLLHGQLVKQDKVIFFCSMLFYPALQSAKL
ncbi:hypothetical protein CAPTEDRAFT_217679 [Capitella teleta]|uniref:Acyl-ACP thioesterase n=1 Tax=Capitella teleta TaxID=283909 RepID=X2AMJ0_CAPTE|nr:hypothetical protein CAPTEDRAFT_217679 [Capitella teleta]|eukprot:ELU00296.1 hypothetical protein CAPTEDRAFT_217679 [Capitella teleta]